MRELEFLPPWYVQMGRRRRQVVVQAWMIVLLVAGMTLALALVSREIGAAEASMLALDDQLAQTKTQLVEMDRLFSLQQQWRHQDLIMSKLGLHAEASRVLLALDSVMPAEMSLLSVQTEIEDRPVTTANPLLISSSSPEDTPVDRRMRVKVQGVAPTDVDLANFMTRLGGVPFLEQVAISYARERNQDGHVMREFEVTFYLNLNLPPGM